MENLTAELKELTRLTEKVAEMEKEVAKWNVPDYSTYGVEEALPVYAYMAELKGVFASNESAKVVAWKVAKKKEAEFVAEHLARGRTVSWGVQLGRYRYDYHDLTGKWCGGGSGGDIGNHTTVFGVMEVSGRERGEFLPGKLRPTRYPAWMLSWPRLRCGIEVLGLCPNAKGSTYSGACGMTVPQLKERCRWNGVPTKGLDKRGLLSALMKC